MSEFSSLPPQLSGIATPGASQPLMLVFKRDRAHIKCSLMTRPNALSVSAECSSKIVTGKAGWCVPTAVPLIFEFQSLSLPSPTQRRSTSAPPVLLSEVYLSEVYLCVVSFFLCFSQFRFRRNSPIRNHPKRSSTY